MTESPMEYADDDDEAQIEAQEDMAQDATDEPFAGNVPPDEDDVADDDPSVAS